MIVSSSPADKVFVFILLSVITLFDTTLQLADVFMLDELVAVIDGLEQGPLAIDS